MPPAAILDIDGTLVDTNYQHAIAWFLAFKQHAVFLPVWRIHRHIGMGGDQLVEALTDARTERERGDDVRAAEAELYVELQYVESGITVEVPDAGRYERERLAKLEAAVRGIQAGAFPAAPAESDNCLRCPFWIICPS